jgi:hypothetical protein
MHSCDTHPLYACTTSACTRCALIGVLGDTPAAPASCPLMAPSPLLLCLQMQPRIGVWLWTRPCDHETEPVSLCPYPVCPCPSCDPTTPKPLTVDHVPCNPDQVSLTATCPIYVHLQLDSSQQQLEQQPVTTGGAPILKNASFCTRG